MRRYISIGLLSLLLLPAGVNAQEATETPTPATGGCPEIVRSALTMTRAVCEGTDLNQACYGHLVMDARPRIGILSFNFNEPGDIVPVTDVQSLRLSALDEDTGQWGVMLMEVAARSEEEHAPATLESDVQILLFGDVALEDAIPFMWVTAQTNVNIRRHPTTESEVIISLPPGERILANGRLEDSSWVRGRLSDEAGGGIGWLSADLVTLDGDIETLAVADPNAPDERATFGPMQGFFFQSGVGDSPCPEAPNSGLLIQTPEGLASVSIWMDEVVIQLDGTAFVQAQPDGNLTVAGLDGTARVEANGETRTIIPGTQTSVALDENLVAADVPSDPIPYDPDTVASLPVDLLDDLVTIPDPATVEPGVPFEGNWLFRWGVESGSCPDGTVVPFESTGATGIIRVQEGGLLWNENWYTEVTPGVYTANYVDGNGNLHQDTLQVIAGDRIQGEKVIELLSPICTLNVPFTVQLISILS